MTKKQTRNFKETARISLIKFFQQMIRRLNKKQYDDFLEDEDMSIYDSINDDKLDD